MSGGDFHRRTLLNAGDGHLLPALPVGRLSCELKGELMTTSAITANGHTVFLGGVKIASTRYVRFSSLPMHRDRLRIDFNNLTRIRGEGRRGAY